LKKLTVKLSMTINNAFTKGIHANLVQFFHLLLQILFVGINLGTLRTVVPALATTEFGLAENSYILLTLFVVAFGLVKAILNFISGRLSEKIGRKKVLVIGWLFSIPIPLLIYFGNSWNYVIAATVLLGINQGLCWSMVQTSKLDFVHQNERGLAIGLNEAFGYLGLAIAGIATAQLATMVGARLSLLLTGMSTSLLAISLAMIFVKESLPWAQEGKNAEGPLKSCTVINSPQLTTLQILIRMSWQDKRFMAICQAGLVEKFVDALVWILYPIMLLRLGISLQNVGWVVGVYGIVWGLLQPFSGWLSDRIGRHYLSIWGMWVSGAGVAAMLIKSNINWYFFSAALSGFGMAMLYPNLSASVADLAGKSWRGSAIGIYRFWRDLGYAIGALIIGIILKLSQSMEVALLFVAIAMFLSGTVLWYWGEETLHLESNG
jgi:MFS family permease